MTASPIPEARQLLLKESRPKQNDTDEIAKQNHWSERGRATSVDNADAAGRPRRSVLSLVATRRVSPHQTFRLDAEGYARCAGLLEAAGMQFVEQERRKSEAIGPVPAMTSISGQLVSQRGTFRCQLVTCEGRHRFIVALHGDADTMIGILDDLERAFAGHLLERHETAA